MKKYILAGNLPYLAVVILCSGAFFAGKASVEKIGKFAVAEKGAIVLQAILDRSSESPETFARDVAQPMVEVLTRYADNGYMVIDASKDDAGNYAIVALPKNVIDITQELRSAIKKTTPPAQTAKEPAEGSGK